jgi:hypothetical protein
MPGLCRPPARCRRKDVTPRWERGVLGGRGNDVVPLRRERGEPSGALGPGVRGGSAGGVGDPAGGEQAGGGGEDGGGEDSGVEAEGVGEDTGDEGACGVADVATRTNPAAWTNMPVTIRGLRPMRSARWPVGIWPMPHSSG